MGSGLDLGWVESQLAATPFAGCVHWFASVGSTNTLALGAAQTGVARGVWVADEQTAGRGRGGHGWHSAAGDGLYMSVLVRPRLVGADALKLSLATGLAAAQAAEEAGFDIDLRWPNDLMIVDRDRVEKKFGGILTESSMEADGALAYAVIGVGMNLNQTALPPELAPIATSLRMVSGEVVSRERLLVRLLRELDSELSRLESPGDELLARFEQASTWVRGLRVQVAEGDGYTGVTDGLDPHGLLRVRLADGSVRTVRHGGVRREG
jgi:BirA family biotin operon repressor/biotin-[acetyl-CoA-carboxylase] ligase